MSSRPPVTPERWRQVKRVFAAALEVEPPARAATVDALCAGDGGLRDEVRSLLSAHGSLSQTGFPGLGLAPAARPLPDPEFPGDDRFEVLARLGAGGFGVVYRALDRVRGRSVALKVLHEPDGLGLVRFKREFRALADLGHPNLVRLDELFAGGPSVFFTMELVDGRAIVEALRPARAAADWVAVGRAFAGVVEGVRALHDQGLVHRDLKPSNVLITESGRAVILDFGLAASLRAPAGEVGAPPAGTPIYMAPEQFLAGGSSPATDWYAVGVMLYDLLAGRLPFGARFEQLIGLVDAKTRGAAPLGPESVADVPPPLVRLCESWLASDAGARPGAEEALAVLRELVGRDTALETFEAGAPAAIGAASAGSSAAHPMAQFVGREAQLVALRAAWARTREGELSVVCLRGASGMGKTLLVRRFLDELRSPEALLLESCCHEREALPFKALDGVVDGIKQLLEQIPRAEAAALRPDGFEDLERLFPVLRSRHRSAPDDAPSAARDDGEQRRRAFSALRELLQRLGGRRPVVLFIDDLQWGDDDSAALLRALLRPDHAPALLLVAACRQDVDVAPAFAGLLDALSSSGRCQEVSVEPLESEETRALAAALLGEGHPEIDTVVAEAGGVPFFVDTLVQEMREHAPRAAQSASPHQAPSDGGAVARDLRLQTVIGGRVRRLPRPERRFLETVAFAGKPLSRTVLEAAADIGESDGRDLERLLRARRFVRLSNDGASLETFHDRVREGVTASVPVGERGEIHGRLARALVVSGTADPEDLAHHLAAAGEREAAAQQAVQAAERRARALAFDRAAALYAMAIDLRGPEHADTGRLATKRAEALASAGHGGAAAQAYFAAAERLPAERATLTCRGAEQLLRAGEMVEGRRVMERVLRRFGWRVPRTAVGALLATVVRRAMMALRELRAPAEPWSEGPRSRENFLLMDASWALASSAMMLDAVRASYYQTHHLRLALAEREPFRLARALGLEAISASLPGARSPARAERMLELQRAVTARATHPIMNGLAPLAEGVVAANRGDWRRARERTLLASELLAAHGSGVAWELSTARSFLLGALASMGRFREYTERFPPFLEDARTRGDLYAEAVLSLSAGSYIVALKDDRVADADAEVDGALAQLGGRGFHLPKIWGLFAKVDIALYARDAEKAWRLLSLATPVMRSLLFYVQTMRVYMRHQRGRVALAMVAGTAASETNAKSTKTGERTRRRFLDLAAREAVALERERLPWGAALALTLRGGIAQCRGDVEGACTLLAEADRALVAADMTIHAAGARHAFGRLRGGREGAAAIADAEACMRDQNVRYPERVAAIVYPGLR